MINKIFYVYYNKKKVGHEVVGFRDDDDEGNAIWKGNAIMK